MPDLSRGHAFPLACGDYSIQRAFQQAVHDYAVNPSKPNAEMLEEMTRLLRHQRAAKVWRRPTGNSLPTGGDRNRGD